MSALVSILAITTLLVAVTTPAQTPAVRANGKIAFTSDRDGNSIKGGYAVNPVGGIWETDLGNFDARGYRMPYGPNSEPRLLPDFKAGQPALSAPCNDGWLDGTPVNGVGGHLNAFPGDCHRTCRWGGSFPLGR